MSLDRVIIRSSRDVRRHSPPCRATRRCLHRPRRSCLRRSRRGAPSAAARAALCGSSQTAASAFRCRPGVRAWSATMARSPCVSGLRALADGALLEQDRGTSAARSHAHQRRHRRRLVGDRRCHRGRRARDPRCTQERFTERGEVVVAPPALDVLDATVRVAWGSRRARHSRCRARCLRTPRLRLAVIGPADGDLEWLGRALARLCAPSRTSSSPSAG